MAKHTPGPWALDVEARHPWIVTCPVEGFPDLPGKVCEVGYQPNARLIAAAPELLAALSAITTLMGNVDHSRGGGENTARLYGGMLESIREVAGAAIAKAEGRS